MPCMRTYDSKSCRKCRKFSCSSPENVGGGNVRYELVRGSNTVSSPEDDGFDVIMKGKIDVG